MNYELRKIFWQHKKIEKTNFSFYNSIVVSYQDELKSAGLFSLRGIFKGVGVEFTISNYLYKEKEHAFVKINKFHLHFSNPFLPLPTSISQFFLDTLEDAKQKAQEELEKIFIKTYFEPIPQRIVLIEKPSKIKTWA